MLDKDPPLSSNPQPQEEVLMKSFQSNCLFSFSERRCLFAPSRAQGLFQSPGSTSWSCRWAPLSLRSLKSSFYRAVKRKEKARCCGVVWHSCNPCKLSCRGLETGELGVRGQPQLPETLPPKTKRNAPGLQIKILSQKATKVKRHKLKSVF